MWKLNADDRLHHWRRLRDNMDKAELLPALELVADIWGQAPFTPFYLDYESPEEWPDPWTLMLEKYYCDLARALGMLYTIHLSSHGSQHSLSLRVMRNRQNRYQYYLVVIDDGKYVLNLESREVLNIQSVPAGLELITEFDNRDLRLELY
jgi:hypothetical protein